MIEKHQVTGTITPEVLFEHGVMKDLRLPLKVMGNGDLSQPLSVRAHKFTGGAKTKIEAAGGTAEVIE